MRYPTHEYLQLLPRRKPRRRRQSRGGLPRPHGRHRPRHARARHGWLERLAEPVRPNLRRFARLVSARVLAPLRRITATMAVGGRRDLDVYANIT